MTKLRTSKPTRKHAQKGQTMIKVKMSYAEMSLLRDLVKAKQLDIWRDLFLGEFEGTPAEEIDIAFDELMNPIYEIPLTDRACCAKLLDRFCKVEEIIYSDLTHMHCLKHALGTMPILKEPKRRGRSTPFNVGLKETEK